MQLRAIQLGRCLAALLLLLAAWVLETDGQTLWHGDVWRVDEGLPNNTVNAIAQSADGYLWLGTQGGLARFDGDRFVRNTDRRLESAAVRTLYLDRAGRLWVLGEKGGVAYIQEGRTVWLGDDPAIPPDGFHAVAEDKAGHVWFAAQSVPECFQFIGQHFAKGPAYSGDGRSAFTSLAFDTDGAMYGVADDHLWKLGQTEPIAAGPEKDSTVTVICPSRAGGFWALTAGECFFMRDGKWKRVAKLDSAPGAASEITAAFEDQTGRFWSSTWAPRPPISIAPDGAVEAQAFNRFPRMLCRALFEDREGNRWWSTSEDGVRRFRPADLKLASDPPRAHAVASDGGQGAWMLSVTGFFHIPNSDGATVIADERVYRGISLLVDRDGARWIGGNRGGLFRVTDDQVVRFGIAGNRNGTTPLLTALFQDKNGDLLAGSPRGIFRLAGDGLEIMPRADSERPIEVHCFAADRDGHAFVGLEDGIWTRQGNEWTRAFTNFAGATAALWFDPDNTLWIAAAGQGLIRKEGGQWFSFRGTSLSLPANIFGIIEDKLGHLWLTSAEGIFRVARADLNAVAKGQRRDAFVRRFDRDDDMLSSQCASGPHGAARTADGKLWFAMARGVYVADPARLSQNSLPPRVVIEEALVDDRRVWSYFTAETEERPRELRVPPDNVRIEFRFTGLSLRSATRNRFRFKLENFDRDWEEGGGRRVAYYKQVPPGNYKFRVMAANNDGVWNEQGASLAITVLTPWWQTAWFRIIAMGSSASGLFAAYCYSRWRQNEIGRLRLRIASDLHDEVGSNLGSIALKAEMLQANGVQRGDLEDINSVALRTANDVRDVAWFINPDFDTLSEMGMRMREVAGRMLAATDWEFEFADEPDRKLTLEFRRNVFFIFKEMLHNVVKHAGAREVSIASSNDGKHFTLEVRDNGVGFSETKSGGQGRRNMERRAREIGGRVTVESLSGKGTTVRLTAPFRGHWFATYDK